MSRGRPARWPVPSTGGPQLRDLRVVSDRCWCDQQSAAPMSGQQSPEVGDPGPTSGPTGLRCRLRGA